jgi:hypothetical protein
LHSERKNSYYIITGQVVEIPAPKLEDLDDAKPPAGGDYVWIAVFCVLLIVVIIGVYFKRKLMG